MGQNSTDVAYGFGQLGSVYQNKAVPVYPPKDHVIVAIQFVANNVLSELHTETLDYMGPQYITIEDDETRGAGGPDANYLGVTEAGCSGVTAAGVHADEYIITLNATNDLIKPGQVIMIGQDGDTIDNGIVIDDLAGVGAGYIKAWTPIYDGPNKGYFEVVSISGTTLTVRAVGQRMLSLLSSLTNIAATNTIYFLDSYHAVGGTTIEGTSFPTGIVIYGRWTMVTPAEDETGGIICYFGK